MSSKQEDYGTTAKPESGLAPKALDLISTQQQQPVQGAGVQYQNSVTHNDSEKQEVVLRKLLAKYTSSLLYEEDRPERNAHVESSGRSGESASHSKGRIKGTTDAIVHFKESSEIGRSERRQPTTLKLKRPTDEVRERSRNIRLSGLTAVPEEEDDEYRESNPVEDEGRHFGDTASRINLPAQHNHQPTFPNKHRDEDLDRVRRGKQWSQRRSSGRHTTSHQKSWTMPNDPWNYPLQIAYPPVHYDLSHMSTGYTPSMASGTTMVSWDQHHIPAPVKSSFLHEHSLAAGLKRQPEPLSASAEPISIKTPAVNMTLPELIDEESLPLMTPGALYETYIDALRKKTEQEMLDANQKLKVLSWMDKEPSITTEKPAPAIDVLEFLVDDWGTDPDSDSNTGFGWDYHVDNVGNAATTSPSREQTSDISHSLNARYISEDVDSAENVCHVDREHEEEGANSTNGDGSDASSSSVETDTLLNQLDTIREELSALHIKMDHHQGRSAVQSTWDRMKKSCRKRPRPGYQRLEWICECGEELYTDLRLENSSQYHNMLTFLRRRETSASTFSVASDMERGSSGSISDSTYTSSNTLTNSNRTTSLLGSSGSTYVDSDGSPGFDANQKVIGPPKYLELCVNIGDYETKLAEIPLMTSSPHSAAICTDAHLFSKIHKSYFALRKSLLRRIFYKPAGIRFVHFGVQAEHRVSFFDGFPLPPEEVTASKQYEYNLDPPIPPPIDSRTFLHYFWKHEKHTSSTSARYTNRIPKKLGESLLLSLGADDLREGWGIHIVEGPNKTAICWTLLSFVVLSVVTAIVYDVVMRGGDSGFGIGQWMVASLSIALSTLIFSLEDEVRML